jgi:MATE family multidrug resistance protein
MSAYQETWRLAWPLILSNLSVPLLGITDVAVVGHLPEPHHLGAVAIGAVVFSVVYFAFGFLRMGTTGLVAQAYGRGDPVELRAGLGRPILLAFLIGVILLLSTEAIVRLSALAFGPSPAVTAELETYLRVRLLGAPAALMNLVLLGWLLGLQNARGPMALLIVTNALNIGLDLLFVLGFGWAVPGVAAATVCAEYGGLALGFWLARRELRGLAGAWSWPALVDLAAFRRLLRVNRDIFLRSCSLQAAFLTFTALGSRQGEVILGANAILLNLQLLASYGLDGFAHAAEAMAGRAVGAGDRAGFRAAVRAGLAWSAGLALALSIVFAAGGPIGIRVMTGLEEVRAVAGAFLPYMVLSPAVSVWAFLFDGVFIGATRTAEMRNGMALALLLFWALAFGLTPVLGNHGLWLAFLAFMAARGLWLGLVFLRIERGAGFVPSGPGLGGRTA